MKDFIINILSKVYQRRYAELFRNWNTPTEQKAKYPHQTKSQQDKITCTPTGQKVWEG